jgi:hypothetical protein
MSRNCGSFPHSAHSECNSYALKWAWEGISSLARAIGDIFLRIVSFLHTVLAAIITFLRTVTLRDIWNAFCDFLRAVFVTVPKTLWSWMESFGDASYRFMKALLGWFGEALWCHCRRVDRPGGLSPIKALDYSAKRWTLLCQGLF